MPHLNTARPLPAPPVGAGARPRRKWKRVLKDLAWRTIIPLFASQPGHRLPPGTPRLLVMRHTWNGETRTTRYVQVDGRSVDLETGIPLALRPPVLLREGDVLLWGKTTRYIALGGALTSLREGRWLRSTVCHCGIVARNADGELHVIHLKGPERASAQNRLLSREQRAASGCFLVADPIDRFYFSPDKEQTSSIVMRSRDPERGLAAARRAQEFFETQITEAGVTPWYFDPRYPFLERAGIYRVPKGQGGMCSTFIDKAYDWAFGVRWMPATPLDIVRSRMMEKVAETRLLKAIALEPAEAYRLRAQATQAWDQAAKG